MGGRQKVKALADRLQTWHIVIFLLLISACYQMIPPMSNIRSLMYIRDHDMGGGYGAVCPVPNSDVYRLIYTPPDGLTFGSVIDILWRKHSRISDRVAFLGQKLSGDKVLLAATLEFGSPAAVNGIEFQMAEKDQQTFVLASAGRNRLLLSQFNINEIDYSYSPTFNQIRQSLGPIAALLHRCESENVVSD